MRRRNLLSLVLALLLFLSLAACNTVNKDPAPPTNGNENAQEQPSPETNPPTEHTTPLRLLLPEGLCAQVVAKINASTLPLQLQKLDKPQEAKDFLLKSTSTDLILLSPQEAAELYRSGNAVQLVALVSLGSLEEPDSMQCLVGSAAFLEANRTFVARFLTEYEGVVSSGAIEGAFLATGWDMVDLVQQSLEEQYAKTPDSKHSIPDGKFYYLP